MQSVQFKPAGLLGRSSDVKAVQRHTVLLCGLLGSYDSTIKPTEYRYFWNYWEAKGSENQTTTVLRTPSIAWPILLKGLVSRFFASVRAPKTHTIHHVPYTIYHILYTIKYLPYKAPFDNSLGTVGA